MDCGEFYLFFKHTESIIFEQWLKKEKLNLKMNLKKNSNQRLTRSGRLTIDKEVLEFCLIKVQRAEYNFSSLESYIVSLAKRKILSSFNPVNEK